MRRASHILRLLVLIGWLASLLLISPQRAFACSCMMPGTPAQELTNSTAVFAGEVTRIQTVGSIFNPSIMYKVTFKVSQVWKGPVQDTLIVETAMDGAACGYSFTVGQAYLVYAGGTASQLSVNMCSRTTFLIAASQDLADLGQSTIPPLSTQPFGFMSLPLLITLISAVVTVLVVAFLIYRWMSRPRLT